MKKPKYIFVEFPTSKHPFFIATQFHPEFTGTPLNPNPLFVEFTKAADSHKK